MFRTTFRFPWRHLPSFIRFEATVTSGPWLRHFPLTTTEYGTDVCRSLLHCVWSRAYRTIFSVITGDDVFHGINISAVRPLKKYEEEKCDRLKWEKDPPHWPCDSSALLSFAETGAGKRARTLARGLPWAGDRFVTVVKKSQLMEALNLFTS